MKASSAWSGTHAAWRARLFMPKQYSYPGAWSAKTVNVYQWIEVRPRKDRVKKNLFRPGPNVELHMRKLSELGPPQTRKHCCGNIVADANVSLFARTQHLLRTQNFRPRRKKCF